MKFVLPALAAAGTAFGTSISQSIPNGPERVC
jgi:hypothetical protein